MAGGVWLLLGPEIGRKREHIESIKRKLAKAYGEPNYHHYHTSDDGWENPFYQDLETVSLFGGWSLVVLSEVDKLTPAQARQLGKFLSSKAERQSTLILESDKDFLDRGIKDEIGKFIPRENTLTFAELRDNEKEAWIAAAFRRAGVLITTDGIAALLDNVENNTVELKIACDQLVSYWQNEQKSTPVDADAVEGFLSNTKDEDGTTLFPAIMARDLSASLRILQQIFLMGGSQTSYQLYATLMNLFRRLLLVEEASQSGMSFYDICGGKLKLFGRPVWIISQRDKATFQTGLRNYTLPQTRSCLAALGEADIPLKGAGDMSQLLWEQLLVSLIRHNGAKAQVPQFVAQNQF